MIAVSSILKERPILRDDRERRETEHEIRDLTPIDREIILREHRLISEEELTQILRECCRAYTHSEVRPPEQKANGIHDSTFEKGEERAIFPESLTEVSCLKPEEVSPSFEFYHNGQLILTNPSFMGYIESVSDTEQTKLLFKGRSFTSRSGSVEFLEKVLSVRVPTVADVALLEGSVGNLETALAAAEAFRLFQKAMDTDLVLERVNLDDVYLSEKSMASRFVFYASELDCLGRVIKSHIVPVISSAEARALSEISFTNPDFAKFQISGADELLQTAIDAIYTITIGDIAAAAIRAKSTNAEGLELYRADEIRAYFVEPSKFGKGEVVVFDSSDIQSPHIAAAKVSQMVSVSTTRNWQSFGREYGLVGLQKMKMNDTELIEAAISGISQTREITQGLMWNMLEMKDVPVNKMELMVGDIPFLLLAAAALKLAREDLVSQGHAALKLLRSLEVDAFCSLLSRGGAYSFEIGESVYSATLHREGLSLYQGDRRDGYVLYSQPGGRVSLRIEVDSLGVPHFIALKEKEPNSIGTEIQFSKLLSFLPSAYTTETAGQLVFRRNNVMKSGIYDRISAIWLLLGIEDHARRTQEMKTSTSLPLPIKKSYGPCEVNYLFDYDKLPSSWREIIEIFPTDVTPPRGPKLEKLTESIHRAAGAWIEANEYTNKACKWVPPDTASFVTRIEGMNYFYSYEHSSSRGFFESSGHDHHCASCISRDGAIHIDLKMVSDSRIRRAQELLQSLDTDEEERVHVSNILTRITDIRLLLDRGIDGLNHSTVATLLFHCARDMGWLEKRGSFLYSELTGLLNSRVASRTTHDNLLASITAISLRRWDDAVNSPTGRRTHVSQRRSLDVGTSMLAADIFGPLNLRGSSEISKACFCLSALSATKAKAFGSSSDGICISLQQDGKIELISAHYKIGDSALMQMDEVDPFISKFLDVSHYQGRAVPISSNHGLVEVQLYGEFLRRGSALSLTELRNRLTRLKSFIETDESIRRGGWHGKKARKHSIDVLLNLIDGWRT